MSISKLSLLKNRITLPSSDLKRFYGRQKESKIAIPFMKDPECEINVNERGSNGKLICTDKIGDAFIKVVFKPLRNNFVKAEYYTIFPTRVIRATSKKSVPFYGKSKGLCTEIHNNTLCRVSDIEFAVDEPASKIKKVFLESGVSYIVPKT